MSDQSTFNAMSALLTGFAPSLITPALDPIGLPETFFETAQTNCGDTFTMLLATYNGLVGQGLDEDAIGPVLLGLEPDPLTNEVIPTNQTLTVQAIMKLWYLGSWYQPFDFNKVTAGTQTVVSDQSYIKGLAWQSMQSHAMGNSTFTFGYWDKPPAASLSETTGNPDVSGQATPNTSGWGTGA